MRGGAVDYWDDGVVDGVGASGQCVTTGRGCKALTAIAGRNLEAKKGRKVQNVRWRWDDG